ncbi:MAG: two-component system repressor protein LuxO, partial [Candidatus Azotimanducaceae bacterium]
VSNVLGKARLNTLVREYEKSGSERHHFAGFIGKSLAMQTIYNFIEAAAPSKASVFITGESGTGKELLAEAIHQFSPRRDQPFIALNCGAIPRELIESEIFGHAKGAFTGANSERKGAAVLANGGTLFLDEICEMDIDLQVKLLRFLQTETFRHVGSDNEITVDIRVVCATNRNPLLEVKEGNFREDLFYRLHVISMKLPALRERNDDALLIAEHLLQKYAEEENKPFSRFDKESKKLIEQYSWPGNIRELQNVIRQVVVLNTGDEVTATMLPIHLRSETAVPVEGSNETPANSESLKSVMKPLWLIEQEHIDRVITHCGDNIPKAASILEVSPSTLYRKQAKR